MQETRLVRLRRPRGVFAYDNLSPRTLRAWCEAGRFLDWEETDQWFDRHYNSHEKVA